MIKSFNTTTFLLTVCLSATTGFSDTRKGEKIYGKKEFEEHCAVCQPNDGNTINNQKPLDKKHLKPTELKTKKT